MAGPRDARNRKEEISTNYPAGTEDFALSGWQASHCDQLFTNPVIPPTHSEVSIQPAIM
jgi:hypothetical protein